MGKSNVSKKTSIAKRKNTVKKNVASSKKKMQQRVSATASALVEAKAELALVKKRQSLLAKMYVRKQAAVAKFMEDWDKREMAKIEKALKPKRKTKRK